MMAYLRADAAGVPARYAGITQIGTCRSRMEVYTMSNTYPKKAAAAGEVRISENVIRSIAGVSAKEIEGVADLASVRTTLLRTEPPVSVQVVRDTVEITVRLVLKNGCRLTGVAEQVQQKIKENVQSMTGVIVSKVHVIAADIMFEE